MDMNAATMERQTVTFDLTHEAGKFSADAGQQRSRINEYIRGNHARTFVGCTEVGPGAAGVREYLSTIPVANGYDVFHPRGLGASETALLAQERDWELLHEEATVTTSYTYMQRSKRERAHNTCTIQVRRHKRTGLVILLSEDHTPSSVDGPHHWSEMVDRVRTYRKVMKGWKRAVRRVAKAFKVHLVFVMGDFNLDAKKEWVRRYLTAVWGSLGLRNVWNPHTMSSVRHDGTHGSRFIDHIWFTKSGRRHGWQIHVDWEVQTEGTSAGFDHRPVTLSIVVTIHRPRSVRS